MNKITRFFDEKKFWILDIPCSILEIKILLSYYIDTLKIIKNYK